MKDTIKRIIKVSRDDTKPLYALTLKLMEEAGELGEAVNHNLGHLPNKKMKEPLEGEVADVIQCAVAVLVRAYPKLSDGDIYGMLVNQLNGKTDKWESVIPKQK